MGTPHAVTPLGWVLLARTVAGAPLTCGVLKPNGKLRKRLKLEPEQDQAGTPGGKGRQPEG